MSSDVLMLRLYFLQVLLNGRASLNPLGGEKTGLTVLDIVKHAVNTVIHTLGPEDQRERSAKIKLKIKKTCFEN